jgi:transcriptional regulator with XRE-family HTH domain
MKNKSLGEIISRRRKNIGLTQTDLANKMEVTEQAVSKWECNQSCPDVATFAKLAETLGLSSDELLSIKENRKIEKAKTIDSIFGIVFIIIAIVLAVVIVIVNLIDTIDSRLSFVLTGAAILSLSVYLLKNK